MLSAACLTLPNHHHHDRPASSTPHSTCQLLAVSIAETRLPDKPTRPPSTRATSLYSLSTLALPFLSFSLSLTHSLAATRRSLTHTRTLSLSLNLATVFFSSCCPPLPSPDLRCHVLVCCSAKPPTRMMNIYTAPRW